jgi:hypothetical protein
MIQPSRSSALAALLLLALAGCGGGAPDAGGNGAPTGGKDPLTAPAPRQSPGAPETPAPTAPPAGNGLAAAMPSALLSCRQEIGGPAAGRRAALCRAVSPATHPPCNVANSCAMIEDEIARACALIGDGADRPAGCGPAARSAAAALDVVRLYYRALAAHDYGTAYAQWDNDGAASGKSYDAFAAGYARTRATRVAAGAPADPEGAAGSSFITVPVTVDAILDNGERQHFGGSYTLRRVNDVPGATPDQLRWHIQSASLHPAR